MPPQVGRVASEGPAMTPSVDARDALIDFVCKSCCSATQRRAIETARLYCRDCEKTKELEKWRRIHRAKAELRARRRASARLGSLERRQCPGCMSWFEVPWHD